MRVLIHDYSGHPFQVQLSRELARRGHTVKHHHFTGFQTPKGALQRRADDPPTFDIEGLELDVPFAKHSLTKRVRQEIRYGHVALTAARAFAPDVVIASNLPLDPLGILQRGVRADGGRFILWWQDIYSAAMSKLLPQKLPMIGRLVAERYRRLERRICRAVDGIVCITEDFLPVLEGWGVGRERATIIENWAPLEEITPARQANAWAAEHDLVGQPVLLYSGTLGLKHNPELLWRTAERLRDTPELTGARVVVVSEGLGAEWLATRLAASPDMPLTILPFQPYARFSEVLGSATVVAAILEPEAGAFSVPSKVLSYLAAGRAILLGAPAQNLASKTVEAVPAGVVQRSDDVEAFADAAVELLREPATAERFGANGRAYAIRTFAIDAIADRFEAFALAPVHATRRDA